MIVVSDTTPIIALLKADCLDLLKNMYGNVLVPKAVYRELTENPNYLGEAEIIQEIGNNLYLAVYNGVRCTAVFNHFNGRYFVDDIYGVQSKELMKEDKT